MPTDLDKVCHHKIKQYFQKRRYVTFSYVECTFCFFVLGFFVLGFFVLPVVFHPDCSENKPRRHVINVCLMFATVGSLGLYLMGQKARDQEIHKKNGSMTQFIHSLVH